MSSGKSYKLLVLLWTLSFHSDAIPKIYDALKVEGEGKYTLEVQQQLGDGVVRTIALGLLMAYSAV